VDGIRQTNGGEHWVVRRRGLFEHTFASWESSTRS